MHSISDLPLALSWSYHVIVAVGSDVGHSPWQVRWSGTCCLIISVIHRSASDLFHQHWRHSFSQCTGTRSAVEALCVMHYTSRQSSSSSWQLWRSCDSTQQQYRQRGIRMTQDVLCRLRVSASRLTLMTRWLATCTMFGVMMMMMMVMMMMMTMLMIARLKLAILVRLVHRIRRRRRLLFHTNTVYTHTHKINAVIVYITDSCLQRQVSMYSFTPAVATFITNCWQQYRITRNVTLYYGHSIVPTDYSRLNCRAGKPASVKKPQYKHETVKTK